MGSFVSLYNTKLIGLPEPMMYWNANMMAGQNGDTVTSWTNLGTGGYPFDLQMSGAGQNTSIFRPRIGADRAHIEFKDSMLETSTPVPNTFTGLKSRTLGCLFKVLASTSTNLIGYGDGTNGGSFDALFFSDGHLQFPNYGNGFLGAGYPIIGTWVVAQCRITDIGNGNMLVENFMDELISESSTITNSKFSTVSSKMYVGGGSIVNYNSNVTKHVASAYAADRALTNQELAHMRALMLQLKPVIVSNVNDTYADKGFSDPNYSR